MIFGPMQRVCGVSPQFQNTTNGGGHRFGRAADLSVLRRPFGFGRGFQRFFVAPAGHQGVAERLLEFPRKAPNERLWGGNQRRVGDKADLDGFAEGQDRRAHAAVAGLVRPELHLSERRAGETRLAPRSQQPGELGGDAGAAAQQLRRRAALVVPDNMELPERIDALAKARIGQKGRLQRLFQRFEADRRRKRRQADSDRAIDRTFHPQPGRIDRRRAFAAHARPPRLMRKKGYAINSRRETIRIKPAQFIWKGLIGGGAPLRRQTSAAACADEVESVDYEGFGSTARARGIRP